MSQDKDSSLYIIGHKNPDTDAICSAIAHASLLKAIGYTDVEAICCGEIPERTQWVLDQANLPAPRLVMDVRTTAGDLVQCGEAQCGETNFKVSQHDTILTAYRTMMDAQLKSVPVVNENNEIIGLLKLADLLQLMMPSQTKGLPVKTIHATFANTIKVLEGSSVGADIPDDKEEEELVLFVSASSSETIKKRLHNDDGAQKKRVAICGDRPEVQQLLLDEGVRALVITGGVSISDPLIAKAKDLGIIVIYSEHDSATTVQLMRCSRSVQTALTEDYICIGEKEAVSSFKDRLTASNQEIFPVIAKDSQTLLGTFSTSALVSPPRKNLVLVDHNEYAQAVKGVEEARVVEVIDHHRLAGDIVTREPITYLNEPVGSTCTLVARKFKWRGIKPDRGTALCLCAGLISDTLNLTSPTTTELDQEILQWLCEIADINAEEFTKGFFEAGSLLLHGSADEIVGVDRKEFKEGGAFVSISQIEEIVVTSLPNRIDEIRASLQSLINQHGYDAAIIAVTDISSHTSTILAAGSESIANAMPYEQTEPGIWHAPGVVSRKKQIFPAMCEAIYKATDTTLEV